MQNIGMFRTRLFAALLLAAGQTHVVANDDFSILMQPSSDPGNAGEIRVFVGEQMAYRPLNMECDRCWVFDTWHSARYRVAEWIHGVPPGAEVEFVVAEHAANVPFGHSRFALVFVERQGDRLALIKYQQVPVYPTEDLRFASCGPLHGSPDDPSEPLDPEGPELRDVVFSPKLVVDDARRLSALGRQKAHDPRWHEIDGDKVLCRRGIPVAELVPAMVHIHETLNAALPQLAGAAR